MRIEAAVNAVVFAATAAARPADAGKPHAVGKDRTMIAHVFCAPHHDRPRVAPVSRWSATGNRSSRSTGAAGRALRLPRYASGRRSAPRGWTCPCTPLDRVKR